MRSVTAIYNNDLKILMDYIDLIGLQYFFIRNTEKALRKPTSVISDCDAQTGADAPYLVTNMHSIGLARRRTRGSSGGPRDPRM